MCGRWIYIELEVSVKTFINNYGGVYVYEY